LLKEGVWVSVVRGVQQTRASRSGDPCSVSRDRFVSRIHGHGYGRAYGNPTPSSLRAGYQPPVLLLPVTEELRIVAQVQVGEPVQDGLDPEDVVACIARTICIVDGQGFTKPVAQVALHTRYFTHIPQAGIVGIGQVGCVSQVQGKLVGQQEAPHAVQRTLVAVAAKARQIVIRQVADARGVSAPLYTSTRHSKGEAPRASPFAYCLCSIGW
jgi:hypothetical protein